MSHPYAFPLHHRNHPSSSTPASSISHLSLNNTLASQLHPPSTSTVPQTSSQLPHTGPTSRSDMTEPSAVAASRIPATTPTPTYVAPERRRRRSSRGLGTGPKRKPSSNKNSLAEAKADPNEPLIPTRTYQFKSFESFDPAPRPLPPLTSSSSSGSLPTFTSSSASTTSLPAGAGYTFGVPTPFAPNSANHHHPGQGGEAADVHAGASSSPGTASHPHPQPPKKSKAIFSVGKKVVKEVLGGGGNNTPLPPEAKAVYYGRGGAGGAGARTSKPNSAAAAIVNQSPQPQVPPQRSESRQTSSFYTGTGSSSNYTPSSYAESIASSPNATSVEDQASVYAPSSSGGLVPVSMYGHRSVSPLEEEGGGWRRDSVVSSSGSDWSGCESSFQQPTVWQNPFAGETIQEVERAASVGPLDVQPGVPHHLLRHRPSQPSLLSAYPRQQRQMSSGRLTPGYTPAASTAANSATSSAESTPYQTQPQPQPQPQQQEGRSSLGGLYPISRPLPDPLATAVGQLSLIQNPLNLGWPVPRDVSALYNNNQNQVAQQSQLAVPATTGLLTPQYTTSPPPAQYTTASPPAQYTPDLTQSLVYQQALAEQQALAKRLAMLEQLQREEEARAAAAQSVDGLFNLGVGGGRGIM